MVLGEEDPMVTVLISLVVEVVRRLVISIVLKECH